MKKIVLTFAVMLVALVCFGQPKYVFLFVGDGMGQNTVHLTETYLSAIEGELSYTPLCMSKFPVCGTATTYSYNALVTDSAASGTAIATGHKTRNGAIGVDENGNPLTSVAAMAKRSGKKVGILTTVGVNHATPASFYGHQPNRNMYDQILGDLAVSDFDFFAGSSILENKPTAAIYASKEEREKVVTDAGYTIVRNLDEYKAQRSASAKMMLLPDSEHSVIAPINRRSLSQEEFEKHIDLKDMVQSAVEYFMQDKCKKGFFIMAEGGNIDGQCHGNDAASAIEEMLSTDEAIQYAYEFYLQHPKETMIVITADHETGGLALLLTKPANCALLQYQQTTQKSVSEELRQMMRSQEEVVSWEQVKNLLGERLGLWREISLDAEEEAQIRAEYDATIAKRESGHVVDPYAYADNAKIVSVAVRVLDKKAGANFCTTGHSASSVPVFAIGAGAEAFTCKNDNTDMCKKIAQIAKYK